MTEPSRPSHGGVGCGAAESLSSTPVQSGTEAAFPVSVAERPQCLASFETTAQPPPRVAVGRAVCNAFKWSFSRVELDDMPNEILTHIFSYLDVSDLLATSRTSHHLRTLSLQPILHELRLLQVRTTLPPLLVSPSRPTLTELIARHIVLTNTIQASRRLGRNLVAIRLSRRLPQRPSVKSLVQRGVLPPECVEGSVIAPGLVARKRAVEKERLKDGLRRWVGGVWRGEVRERGEDVRQCDERIGTGRVWRLRRFWERVAVGETVV